MATHPLPDRFLRLRAVLDRTGLSRATLYRKINAATFPPQQKLSERCSGWRESHVNIWLRNPTTFTIADLPDEPDCKPQQNPAPPRRRRVEARLNRRGSR